MNNPEKACIFIIDDSPANLKVLDDLLKQSGFKVLVSRSGKSGIEKIQSVQPDLILLDIIMPEMDGFAICKCLKSLPKTREIPIIFMSALSDTVHKVKGLNLGAVDYITKPFQQEEVLARIELHLKLRNLTKTLEKQNYQLQVEIQQRQQIEQQLRILSLACEQSPASIVITNAQGNIEYVNPKFEAVTGYTFGEVRGQNPRVLKSGYTSDDEYKTMWEELASGKEWNGEFHNKKKNGELYWELASISPIQDDCGEVTHFVAVKEDITTRKASEEKLRNSEQKFKTIFDFASDGIVIVSLEGKFLMANHVFCEQVNYSQEELLMMSPKDIDAPEYAALFASRMEHLKNREHLIFESVHLRKDGTPISVEVNSRLIQFDGETVILGIIRDITQRKQMESALQAERNFSSAILETVGALIIVLDSQGRIIRFNRACEQLTGYTFSEVKQKIFWEFLIPPEEINSLKNHFKNLNKGIFPNQFENPWLTKNQKKRLIEWHNTVLKDLQDQTQYIIGTGIDITERKQAEEQIRQLNIDLEKRVEERTQELRQSEAKFGKYFEQSLIGMAITDITKNWLEVNDRLCEMLGYSREELSSLTWADITPTEDLEKDLSYFDQILAGEIDGYSLDKGFIRKDRQRIDVSISLQCLRTPQGQVDYCVKLIQDISDRKKAEEQLKITNAELARATRLKDEFLANMSHELRTPLNAILGMSEGILEEVYGPLNEGQRKSLKTIYKSGQHLLELINDILDLSKIESGKLELNIAPCNIRSLCTSSLAFVKQQALKKNIKLITSIEEDPEIISLDERRMRQVLINLLNNAVKFTANGGKVILEVRFRDEPARISFSVMDTGIGIAPEDIKRLFQVFTQLDSSLNRTQEGTGLGLALVKRISELHGGTVTVDSEVGKGSCFTVTLPYLFQSEPPKAFIEPQKPILENVFPVSPTHSQPPLILLAEDNEANVETLWDYLECKGYHIMIAKNGQEAIALCQTQKPHLILMDISMPDMDGLEAIKCIRQDQQLESIPIIALTALAMSGDRDKCIQAGANEYLSKPVSLKQLTQTIEKFLG